MESTFTSKEYRGFFDENLIPELTKIALDPNNVHFTNTSKVGRFHYTAGAHFTMAANWAMIS